MTSKWVIKEKYGGFEVARDSDGRPLVLGQGTFGITVEAERKRRVGGMEIVERYALKILDPMLFESATMRAQFITELTSVQGISGPNLVRDIDYGVQDGQPYVVMDLCEGGNLGDLMQRLGGPLPERLAARIGAQVACGLQCLHEKKMVHRDIKPGNIMLACGTKPCSDDDMEALLRDASLCRIADFGFVLSTEGVADASSRRYFVGTLTYASPEQIRRRKDIDGRADLYALGMTLWHLVKGSIPLTDGDRKLEDEEIEDRHLSEKEHETDFPPGLSAEFHAILARMVAKDREHRCRNAAELGDDLRRYLAGTASAGHASVQPAGKPSELEMILKRADTTGARHYIETDDVLGNVFFYAPIAGSGGRRLMAVHHGSGRRGRLTLEPLPENPAQQREDIEKVTMGLIERARRLNHPDTPSVFLGGIAVIKSRDALAWFEEPPPEGVTLADLIKARVEDDRSLTFKEAAGVFRQIAEALDHIVPLTWNTISLPAEAVWLTCHEMDSGGDLKRWLLTPLDEWENLRVRFSGVCIPPSPNKNFLKLVDPSQAVTRTMGIGASEEQRHPLKAFLRLVYHTCTGEVLIPAADRHAREYVATDKLSGATNNLIRNQLSGQQAGKTGPEKLTPDIFSTLSKLCHYESLSFVDEVKRVDAFTPVITAPATPHFAMLPVAVIVSAASRLIRSPHASLETQIVPKAKWLGGTKLRCMVTDEFFRLPDILPSSQATKIAISYRRLDSKPVVSRFYEDLLVPKFGENNVLIDLDSISPGENFRLKILDSFQQSAVILVFIGRQWQGERLGRSGQSRLHNDGDYVRLEVAEALRLGCIVIPVLIDRTPMPKHSDLPSDVADLAMLQAFELDSGNRFKRDSTVLVEKIQQLLDERAGQS